MIKGLMPSGMPNHLETIPTQSAYQKMMSRRKLPAEIPPMPEQDNAPSEPCPVPDAFSWLGGRTSSWCMSCEINEYDITKSGTLLMGRHMCRTTSTAFHASDMLGHNFDALRDSRPAMFVRTPAASGRYATYGMAAVPDGTTADTVDGNVYSIMPYYIVDGINSRGLCGCVNQCRQLGDMAPDTRNLPISHAVTAMSLLRLVLDTCATVDEAIAYVNAHKFADIGTEMAVEHSAYMFADPSGKCAILAFTGMTPVWCNHDRLTNYVSSDIMYGSGMERQYILETALKAPGPAKSRNMAALEKTWYSNAYDLEQELLWYTDFNGKVFVDGTMHDLSGCPSGEADAEKYRTVMDYRAEHAKSDPRGVGNTCETVHSVLYHPDGYSMWLKVKERETSDWIRIDLSNLLV